LRDNPEQKFLVVPIHLVGPPQHFTGLYINRGEDAEIIFNYIDPFGAGDIPAHIIEIFNNVFPED